MPPSTSVQVTPHLWLCFSSGLAITSIWKPVDEKGDAIILYYRAAAVTVSKLRLIVSSLPISPGRSFVIPALAGARTAPVIERNTAQVINLGLSSLRKIQLSTRLLIYRIKRMSGTSPTRQMSNLVVRQFQGEDTLAYGFVTGCGALTPIQEI